MSQSVATLEELIERLPSAELDQDVDLQARAALRMMLQAAVARSATGCAVQADPTGCPNCDSPLLNERSPYCSDRCREESGLVRQLRNGLREGSLQDPERQIALGEKVWRVLGGGYPRRHAKVEPKSMAKVIAKYEGICQECGAPATTVEHIGSG